MRSGRFDLNAYHVINFKELELLFVRETGTWSFASRSSRWLIRSGIKEKM